MFDINHSYPEQLKIINRGLQKFKVFKPMLMEKNFIEGIIFSQNSQSKEAIIKYKEALKIMYFGKAYEYLALEYFNNRQPKEALPYLYTLIKNNDSPGGKNEYVRGRCYLELNKLKNACLDFKAAYLAGYPVEAKYLQLCK